MPELLRPDPPRSIADRVRDLVGGVSLVRVAAGLAAVLALGAGGWWLLHPAAPPVEAGLPRAGPAPGATTPAAATPTATASPPGTVVVQVAGAVVRPGVYRLPAGARIVDLLTEAGGPTPEGDPDAVALAAPLVDGQRVEVPKAGELLPSDVLGLATTTLVAGAPSGPIGLNTATTAELDELPGIGPATAAAIVAHRDEHGPFSRVDELLDVPGIGPAKLEALRDLVVV